MRGKRDKEEVRVRDIGITPAGAGKTFERSRRTHRARDHPRRCGENNPIKVRHLFDKGSPPQVRGKPMLSKQDLDAARITPAGAGKTLYALPKLGNKADHPRRCGEN